MEIISQAFKHEDEIPRVYTCEGKDISPPLEWKNVPTNAKSLVLIVEDPDAPDPKAPKMLWIHWVLYNIDPQVTGLSENITIKNLPAGAVTGITSWNNPHYGGPCPPIGKHRYYFRLYALDVKLPQIDKLTAENLKKAIKDHVLAEAVLMGTYQKA